MHGPMNVKFKGTLKLLHPYR